jgi:hypothetical protein
MISNAQAAYTVTGVPAIVSGTADDPTLGYPADMQTLLTNPTKYTWNPVNVRLGKHPDRPNGVIYVFENAADAQEFSDGSTSPDYIPDTAVGYIHWDLDNGSGQFPGIMAITDDFGFKTNNCFMASGEQIPIFDENEEIIGSETKTCSNPQGSGKRFKMVLLRTDAPFDLVFNTATQDLTYSKYDDTGLIVNGNGDPIDADGDTLTPDFLSEDVFRNYRFIMKWGNGTATDVVSVADGTSEKRDGDRISGFGVQLGSYDTDPANLTPFKEFADSDPGDGLFDEGIGYELRLCIADAYFNELSGQSQPGTSDCASGFTEVWLENEYATFSPAMYSYTTDKRSSPVGGFWDKNPAGVYAPQIQQDTQIDAGTDLYDKPDNDVWGVDGTHTGQTTTNYFEILSAQAEDALAGTLQGSYFGYMMNYGVISEGDVGTLPWAAYIDEDGDPATEGDVYAWWDGEAFRWGIDPNSDGNNEGKDIDPMAWMPLSEDELEEIASRPLDEDRVLEPPRYEIGVMDDLGGLNVDTFIKLQSPSSAEIGGETIDRAGFDPAKYPQIAVRFTADAIEGVPGSEDGPWVDNPPPTGEEFFDGISIDDVSQKEGGLNETTDFVFTVTLSEADAANDVIIDYTTNDGTATAGSDYTAVSGTLTFPAGTTMLTQTITVPVIGDWRRESDETFTVDLSLGADNKGEVVLLKHSGLGTILNDDRGSSSGCSIGTGAPLDPTLPLLVLAGLAGLGLRRRMSA